MSIITLRTINGYTYEVDYGDEGPREDVAAFELALHRAQLIGCDLIAGPNVTERKRNLLVRFGSDHIVAAEVDAP